MICTPDKDLGQCVGGKVVQLDRRRDILIDADGVRAKFGVPPASIPDWLALVGDTADGFPGLPGLRCEDGGGGARPLRPHRGDPRRRQGVGRHRSARRRPARVDARDRPCGRGPVQGARDPATDAPVGTVDDWEWHGTDRRSRAVVRTRRMHRGCWRGHGSSRNGEEIGDIDAATVTIDRERARHRAGDAEPSRTPERDEPRARSRAARRLRGDRRGPDVPRHRADRCGSGLLRGPRPERGREPAGDGRDGTGSGGHDGPEAHRRTRARRCGRRRNRSSPR